MAPDGACEVAQNTARSNAKSEAERVERPLASPDDHRELVITCGSCFTNAGGRFSGLPGLLQVALDGSWWHHVLPDCLRYLQMARSDSRCSQMSTWSYYPGKLFYKRGCLLY